MDGGSNNILQKAAVPLLEPGFVEKDALALQAHFREKRDFMVRELEAMGIKARVPKSTFYIWADVSVAYCVCSMAWRPTRVSPHRRCRRR